MKRRRIDDALTRIDLPQFPACFADKGRGALVVIGIGGNVGDTARRFERLMRYWRSSRGLVPVETAPVLKNPPFGFVEQNDFLNTVAVVRTALPPKALMRYLLEVERRFGRVRSFPNAPRTLDLDILFYADRRIHDERLSVPHPRWRERESVTLPLRWLLASRRRRGAPALGRWEKEMP